MISPYRNIVWNYAKYWLQMWKLRKFYKILAKIHFEIKPHICNIKTPQNWTSVERKYESKLSNFPRLIIAKKVSLSLLLLLVHFDFIFHLAFNRICFIFFGNSGVLKIFFSYFTLGPKVLVKGKSPQKNIWSSLIHFIFSSSMYARFHTLNTQTSFRSVLFVGSYDCCQLFWYSLSSYV